jgi:hypothetical protein
MARKYWKQPISVSLDKDVMKILRDMANDWGVSRSSIVQEAILFMDANQKKKPQAVSPGSKT